MRDTPRVGDKAWFGPRELGWGWTPIAWQGWLVSGVGLSLTLFVSLTAGVTAGIVTTLVVAAVLVALALLRGTSPGKRSER